MSTEQQTDGQQDGQQNVQENLYGRIRRRNAEEDRKRQERKPFLEVARAAGMLSGDDKDQRR